MQTQSQHIMPTTANVPTVDTITPRDTADLLNRSIVTLERWRRLRIGPPYLRICGRVLYRRSDIAAWLEAQTVGGVQ